MAVAIIGLAIRFTLLGKESQQMQVNLGPHQGGLKPCLKTSNCYHSDQLGGSSRLKEIDNSALKEIKEVLLTMGMQSKKEEENYLHFTSQSKLFGFVDDVEFYHTQDRGLQFRSSSRVGNSDLGVNEKRIKEILKTAINLNL